MGRVSEPSLTGARASMLTRVQDAALASTRPLAAVADPGAGGTCMFVGTVRDHSEAGDVTGLTYEAWDELAERRLHEIAEEIPRAWPVRRVAILHRIGDARRWGRRASIVAVSRAASRRGLRGVPPRRSSG